MADIEQIKVGSTTYNIRDTSKANKVSSATAGDVATLDANGNLVDSGKTLGKSVPSDAKFTDTTYSQISRGSNAGLAPGLPSGSGTTKYLREDGSWQVPPDTNTWRGIQDNLTSTSTTDSLSAAQGKVLNDYKIGKAGTYLAKTAGFTASGQPFMVREDNDVWVELAKNSEISSIAKTITIQKTVNIAAGDKANQHINFTTPTGYEVVSVTPMLSSAEMFSLVIDNIITTEGTDASSIYYGIRNFHSAALERTLKFKILFIKSTNIG